MRPEEVLTFRVVDSRAPSSRTTSRSRARTSRSCDSLEAIPGVTLGRPDVRRSPWTATTATIRSSSRTFPTPGGQMPPLRRFKWIAPELLRDDGQSDRRRPGRSRGPTSTHARRSWSSSENFAREYWKEPAAAIGRRIRQTPKNPWREIVGVVGDERDDGVDQPAPTIVYWPLVIAGLLGRRSLRCSAALAYAVRSARTEFADAAARRCSRRCGR